MIKRTHTCGQLSIKDLNKTISLNGWISKTRDLGSLIFIDLKDRYGTTQVVSNQDTNKDQLYQNLIDEKLFEILGTYFANQMKEKSTDKLRAKKGKI